MEFIDFLSTKEKDILALVQKAGFSIEENTPLCLLGKKYFGFLKKRQKSVVICTNNAKEFGGYFIPRIGRDDEINKTAIYIRRALRHESIHVAQQCNNDGLLNIVDINKREIHPYKEDALIGSSKISGNREKEYEAYLLEDKPRVVKSALEKYCF